MKIKTRFDIGDTVYHLTYCFGWFFREEPSVIAEIEIFVDSQSKQEVMYIFAGGAKANEDYVFRTKAVALVRYMQLRKRKK